jgi:hypothetical protein
MNDTYIAEYVVARSVATIVQSRLRIAGTRLAIAAMRRRQWRAIRGGSGADAETTSTHLRARVRLLVNPNEIPRIFSGYCTDPRPCDICSRQVVVGSTEYEVGFSALTFRLDAECFGLWQEEMVRTAKQARR